MTGNNRRAVLLGGACALLGGRASGAAPERAPIRLGVIDLSFHRATAAVVTALLEQMGHRVERHFALHEACFDLLRTGAVDMVASAWLNASHGVYRARVEEVVPTRALGLHYQPYAFWGVPDHVPASKVSAIQDLVLPDVRAHMHPVIQGIGPGAGITRFSRQAMQAYRLDEAGYRFQTGSEEDCFTAFEEAVAAQQWRVVPLWHPQFLHARHKIRELKDSRQLFGGVDRAVLLAREDRLQALPEDTVQALDRMRLSNGIVSGLDLAISRLGQSPDEAAAEWMRNHPDLWRAWRDRAGA